MSANYGSHVSAKGTPQSEAIPGTDQVKNSAGGYAWAIDDWTRLDRFLVLGSEGGTYYAGERKLTRENAAVVERLLRVDTESAARLVFRLVEMSDGGRIPKNDPAIFALGLAIVHAGKNVQSIEQKLTEAKAKVVPLEDMEAYKAERIARLAFQRLCADAVPKICRIGTHLFQLAEVIEQLGGWGRGVRRIFGDWYVKRSLADAAFQIVKYQSRNGWAVRDILRKAHVKPKGENDGTNSSFDPLFRWACAGAGEEAAPGQAVEKRSPIAPSVLASIPDLAIVAAFEKAKVATDAREIVNLIREHNLPRECIPTQHLNDRRVWAALLGDARRGMPIGALIRNLGKMTAVGLIEPLSDAEHLIFTRLGDADALAAGRIHPMSILLALRTYAQGHGDKGKLSWVPSQRVVAALDAAFYTAFKAVEPTGKRFLLGLDISGSMGAAIGGTSITCREATAAMALVTMATEARHHAIAFTAGGEFAALNGRNGYGGGNGLTPLPDLSPKMRLDKAMQYLSGFPMGYTDCALPMLYAAKRKLDVDVFVIYTDNESWAGTIHAAQALKQYRDSSGLAAKLVVMAFTASGFSVADPNDPGMLDVCGFDAAVPDVIRSFVME